MITCVFGGTRSRKNAQLRFLCNPLRPLAEWKGNDGGFYCSEFCADAGETIEPVAASQPPEMASTAGASYDR